MAKMMGATCYRGQTYDDTALTSGQVRAHERRAWLADWADDVSDSWFERNGLGWLLEPGWKARV